ncbi:hypothetical protein D9M68_875770 [compost metagenome]
MQVVKQGAHARFGQRRRDQAENSQRGQVDHQLDDRGHSAGEVGEHLLAAWVGMPEGETQADGPGQDADEVAGEQGVDRVVDHVQQQGFQHFADAAGWRQFGSVVRQGQA